MEYVVVQRGLSYRNASIQLKSSREEEEWREYKSSIIFISCHRPKFSLRSIFVFFIFIFFKNIFYRNIFSISQFTALYPYRPAGGRQGACRPSAGQQGLICKLKKIYLRGSPWREPAGPLPPIHWAAGSPILYKRVSLPSPPRLLPTTSREREGERRGEGGSCNGEALSDFGS